MAFPHSKVHRVWIRYLTVILAVGIISACAPKSEIELTEEVLINESPTSDLPVIIPTIKETPTPLPSLTPSPTPEPGVLVVDASQLLGEVNPFVYGSNAGPWQTITKADIELIKAAGISILRFPGGSYVDENSPSQSALDEFITLCREVNAEPMVQVKLVNSTAKAAADMVTYANITKGYGIKYWSIGNEPSLYWGKRGIDGYDTVTFNAQWREFALAMKSVDDSIILLGPEIHQYTGKTNDPIVDIHYLDWMREFLIANGDLVDVVSFHRYPFGNYDPFENELLRSSEEWDEIIPKLNQLIYSTTGRDIPVAITEINSNWSNRSRGDTTPDTLLNAIWWSDSLGRMIEQNVSIVNQFALDGNGGWALLNTQDPRPSYYVYLLYRNFGNQLVYTTSGIDLVSIYASLDQSGDLSLIIINRNTDTISVPLKLLGFTGENESQWMMLDAGHLADIVSSQPLKDGSILELAPLSVISILIQSGN